MHQNPVILCADTELRLKQKRQTKLKIELASQDGLQVMTNAWLKGSAEGKQD